MEDTGGGETAPKAAAAAAAAQAHISTQGAAQSGDPEPRSRRRLK